MVVYCTTLTYLRLILPLLGSCVFGWLSLTLADTASCARWPEEPATTSFRGFSFHHHHQQHHHLFSPHFRLTTLSPTKCRVCAGGGHYHICSVFPFWPYTCTVSTVQWCATAPRRSQMKTVVRERQQGRHLSAVKQQYNKSFWVKDDIGRAITTAMYIFLPRCSFFLLLLSCLLLYLSHLGFFSN